MLKLTYGLSKKIFFLGHDEPLYKVDRKYLKNKKFWIHAKNLDCFYELSNSKLNYFWHESDKVIFTSKGYFWNYPGTNLTEIKYLRSSRAFKNLTKPNFEAYVQTILIDIKK